MCKTKEEFLSTLQLRIPSNRINLIFSYFEYGDIRMFEVFLDNKRTGIKFNVDSINDPVFFEIEKLNDLVESVIMNIKWKYPTIDVK